MSGHQESRRLNEQRVGEPPRRSLLALSKLRAKLRRLRLIDGALIVLLFLATTLVLSFGLDYWLELPWAIRAIFLLGGIGFFVSAVRRRLVSPMSVKVSDEDLALLVEDAEPEMQQALITAIQLSAPDSAGARFVSASLLASVVEDLEQNIDASAFDKVLRPGRVIRNAAALSLLTLVVLGGALSAPDLVQIWLRRNLLLAAEAWPNEVWLEIASMPETVAVGDDFVVEVRLLKGQPKLVEVEQLTEDGKRRAAVMDQKQKFSWDLELLRASSESGGALEAALRAKGLWNQTAVDAVGAGAGVLARHLRLADAEELEAILTQAGHEIRLSGYDVYVYEFRNVSQSLEFWVEGGDHRIGPFAVAARLRPRIDMSSVQLSFRYPDYTGDTSDHVQKHGNLKVPVGTRVSYSMATNIAIGKAFFVLKEGESRGKSNPAADSSAADAWPDESAVALEVSEGRNFSGSFVVDASGHYFFQFEDEKGFRSGKPERFRIQGIEDRKPKVLILEPGRVTDEVTADAKVRIRVGIEDDYGVKRAVIEGGYYPPSDDERVPQSIALTLPEPAVDSGSAFLREGEVELILDVSSIATRDGKKPAPGSRFEFYALAEDTGNSGQEDAQGNPVGNIGESQVHMLKIVDRETLQRNLTDQLMVVRDQLRNLRGRQEAVRKNVQDLRDEHALQGQVDRESAQKLSRHRQDQSKVGEGLDRQAKEIDRILKKMDSNSVGDERWKNWVSGIRDEIKNMAEKNSPEIESKIDTLRRDSKESPQEITKLDDVVKSQRQLERDLRSVVGRLDEFGDKSAIIQFLREVKKRQELLRDATKDRIGTETK